MKKASKGGHMRLKEARVGLFFHIVFELQTPLVLSTGDPEGDLDNTLDVSPDNRLCINGYAWSSLLRRALMRLETGASLARVIGKFHRQQPDSMTLSPLWFRTSLVDLPGRCDRAGNVIQRPMGAARKGLLFVEEVAMAGLRLPMDCIFFLETDTKSQEVEKNLEDALWVIESGIENLGGGWSYGFGRLRVHRAYRKLLDFSKEEDRRKFAALMTDPATLALEERNRFKVPQTPNSSIALPWLEWKVEMGLQEGQLMAIHMDDPTLAVSSQTSWPRYPDRFVFRTLRWNGNKNKSTSRVVIPGKALRQAFIATQIERRLEAEGVSVCDPTTGLRVESKENPRPCLRCLWFGSTERSGIVAVLDASVNKAQFELLQRGQFCEHSRQNMHLFAEEYLKRGNFSVRILLDLSRKDCEGGKLEGYIDWLLRDLKKTEGPAGWYRIGANATCTGQLCVLEENITKRRIGGNDPHE